MNGCCKTVVSGEELWLLPQRALFWPAHRMLIVADAHIGKAATFRARGIPLPRGSSSSTLTRLSVLIEAHRAQRVVFLGDLLHSRESKRAQTMSALHDWRRLNANIGLQLVVGNHDRQAGTPPDMDIEVLRETLVLEPFELRHEPRNASNHYVIAGHVHPAVRIYGPAHEAIQLPCFVFGSSCGVLPAFGDLTGSAVLSPGEHERVFACADDRVFELPPRAQAD